MSERPRCWCGAFAQDGQLCQHCGRYSPMGGRHAECVNPAPDVQAAQVQLQSESGRKSVGRAQRRMEMADVPRLDGAPQEDGELRAAAQALVDKLDEVCASPEWGSVFALADLHHAPYRGPTFGPERDALKAALSTPAGTPPVELTTDSARKGRSVMKRDIEIVATPDNTATVKVEGHELHGITAIDFSIRAGYPRREPDVTITVLSDRFSYAGPADLVVNSVLGTEPLIGVLRRYIEHVEGCEGDNFIDSLDPDDLLSEEDRGWLRAIRALPR